MTGTQRLCVSSELNILVRYLSSIVHDSRTVLLVSIGNRVFMYVSAIFGVCRPGGATCVSAAAVAVRGRTGSAGAGATSHAARGAEGAVARRARLGRRREACARRPKGLCEGTFRRDFAKGLFEGTLRRDFSKGLSKGLLKDFNIYTWQY